jgi:hypothetical protein
MTSMSLIVYCPFQVGRTHDRACLHSDSQPNSRFNQQFYYVQPSEIFETIVTMAILNCIPAEQASCLSQSQSQIWRWRSICRSDKLQRDIHKYQGIRDGYHRFPADIVSQPFRREAANGTVEHRCDWLAFDAVLRRILYICTKSRICLGYFESLSLLSS